jgi:hypothetical protein
MIFSTVPGMTALAFVDSAGARIQLRDSDGPEQLQLPHFASCLGCASRGSVLLGFPVPHAFLLSSRSNPSGSILHGSVRSVSSGFCL